MPYHGIARGYEHVFFLLFFFLFFSFLSFSSSDGEHTQVLMSVT